MARLAVYLKQLSDRLTPQGIASGLVLFGVLVFAVGLINEHCPCTDLGLPNLGETPNDLIGDFYANVSVDSVSVAFAILVIERLNRRRADGELKAQFIREMGSTDNGIALRAVKELRARGWLTDGSLEGAELRFANLQNARLERSDLQEALLEGADLQGANLSGANLYKAYLPKVNLRGKAYLREANLQLANLQRANLEEAGLGGANMQKAFLPRANMYKAYLENANLQNANLQGVNLQSARLIGTNMQGARLSGVKLHGAILFGANLDGALDMTNHQLVTAAGLRGATMPDGSRYDGRFNLSHDLNHPIKDFFLFETPENTALWYGVSLEEYLAGQEWARENLQRLRREAELHPDTGLPLSPINSAEPEPVAVPAQLAPHRNGQRHKRSRASMVAHRVRR